jgi:hypothetical protein
MRTNRSWRSAFARAVCGLFFAAALTACGGGGGGGGTNPPPGGGDPPNNPPGNPPDSGLQEPTIISAQGQGAMGDARVVMDAAGNAMAVWRQGATRDFDGDRMWARRYTPGTGWGSIELLASGSRNSVSLQAPTLGINPASGRVVALWVSRITSTTVPNVDLVARVFDPTTGWGLASVLDTAEGGQGLSPEIAAVDVELDASDTALVAWSEMPALTGRGRFSIWTNRLAPTGTWAGPVLIEQNNGVGEQDISPQVALLGDGNALVAWTHSTGSRTNIWSNNYRSGNWGSATVTVDYDGTDSVVGGFDLASGQDGNATLVWGQLNFKRPENTFFANIWAKRYSAGAWSSTDTPIGPDIQSTSTMATPRLKISAGNVATAMWVHPLNSRAIYVNQSFNGAPWEIAQVANPAEERSLSELPDFGADSQGNITLVWTRSFNDGSLRDRIFGARYLAGIGWGVPEPYDTYSDDINNFVASSARLAVNSSGASMIVWGHVFDINTIGSQIVARKMSSGR